MKKNIAYNFILRIVSKFLTYFLLLAFANLFLKDEYGKAMYVMSVFNLATAFIFLGFPNGFVSYLVKKKNVKEIFSSVFSFVVIATFCALIFSIIKPIFLPLAIALPFLFIFMAELAILQSKHQHHIFQLTQLLIVIIPISMIFFLKEYQSLGIILSYSIGFILTSILTFFWVKKEIISLFKFQFKWKITKDYLGQAIPLVFLGFCFMILGWVDTIILGLFSTYENVAKYNIASPIANFITIVPLSIGMFLLTRTAQIKHSFQVLERAIRISFSLSIILAIFIASLLNLLIQLFFPKYIGIAPFATILLIGIAIYSAYILIVTYYAGKLTANKALLPVVVAMLVNIILDVLLIPKFGLYGICSATAIAHVVAFTMLMHKIGLLKKYLGIYLMLAFIPASFYLGYYGIFLIPLAIALLFLFRLIELSDIRVITDTAKSIIINTNNPKQK